jgi:VirE N-terminal domain
MPINLSFLETVFRKDVQQTTLDEVIGIIRSEELTDFIKKLRAIKDITEYKQFKTNLPAFFPTLFLGSEKNELDSNSQPTGIIQFDVDKKDNPDLDFALFRQLIEKLPETIYSFNSPSQGLKFGLLTDFKRAGDDENQQLQDRFKQAYRLASDYVVDSVSMDFKMDDSVGNLKWICFLSNDPTAYFNPDCMKFAVDAHCAPLSVKQSSYTPNTVDQDFVAELLAYIPADYGYKKRLPINASVLAELGHSGIPMLERHWTTEDKIKLSKDLRKLLKKIGQGNFTNNIGTLINEAIGYGFKQATGKQRSSLKPKAIDLMLEPLLSAAEAEAKLKDIVQQFFTDKISRFVNFSAGAGKTYTLIKALEKVNPTSKILYLVKTHELAGEITKTFSSVRSNRKKQTTFREKVLTKSKIIHVKGRSELCENATVKEKYNVADKKTAIPIPADQCTKDCYYEAHCAYTQQFNTTFEGIRVMMFNEYFNQPSRWFNGIDAEGNPTKRRWQPDFIIIDENIFDKESERLEKYGKFESIDKIIHEVKDETTLEDTIIKYRKEVCFNDDKQNLEDKPIKFVNADQYLRDFRQRQTTRFSPLLRQLARFAKTEDKSLLKGMRVENGRLVQSLLKVETGRFQNIPTLYLDATANKEVVSQLLPNIQFHSIQVQAKPDINVYQLANTTITKKKLKDVKNLNQLIEGLKKLLATKHYRNPGLITYKSIEGIPDNFASHLAGKLGIRLFGHFGNLRGVNKFDEVDCLIILGRYSLNPTALREYTYAVFGHCLDIDTHYQDSLVRMKDGSVSAINTAIHNDPDVRAIYDHFSVSETKQAIGRGRLIHGKPKDIYYLSNENIGTDIEITDFYTKKTFFISH